MGLLSIPTSSSSSSSSSAVPTLFLVCCAFFVSQALGARIPHPERFLPFIWPLPEKFSFGNETLSLDPALSLSGNGAAFNIVREAFERYKGILFKHGDRFSFLRTLRPAYDVNKLSITVHSNSEEVVFFSFFFFFFNFFFLSGSSSSLVFEIGNSCCSFNLEWMKATICSFQEPISFLVLGGSQLRCGLFFYITICYSIRIFNEIVLLCTLNLKVMLSLSLPEYYIKYFPFMCVFLSLMASFSASWTSQPIRPHHTKMP